MSSIAAQRSGSGGNGNGCERIARSRVASVSAALEQVERYLGAEAAGADAETGVAERVGDPSPERGPVEGEEARAGVDRASPPVAEADPLELREGGEEVAGEVGEGPLARLALGSDPAGVVVDRVEAAPEDAPVGGRARVVEAVRHVAEPLAAGPADRRALLGAQRLGDQHVVPDRNHALPGAPKQPREGAGREQGPAGADRARLGDQGHPGAVALDPADARVLVDPDAELLRGPREPPAELRRVDHGRARTAPDPAEEQRRVDLGADRVAIEHLGVVTEPRQRLGVLVEQRQLVRLDRDVEVARGVEVALDPEPLEVSPRVGEVLEPEPLERRHLVGKPGQAVVDPVGEEGGEEASVATAGGAGELASVEHDHLARRGRAASPATPPRAR